MRNALGGMMLGLACLLAGAGCAFAQDAAVESPPADAPSSSPASPSAASSSPVPTSPASTSAVPTIKALTAGQLRGELLTTGDNLTLTSGGAAFAQITLSTAAPGKKGQDAEIAAEASNGEIVSIAGTGIETEGAGASMRARVQGLRKGRDRNLLVEVKLPAADRQRTTLKVTLRPLSETGKGDAPAAAQEASAEISWGVRNCAGGYYGALQAIRDNAAWHATQKWKEAAKSDDALPKKWLFTPKEERRSRRSRRSESGATAASPSRTERDIFAEAGKLVRAGKDPALDRKTDLGWVLGKVSTDLDTYLSQPINPAICTGALGMTDYYHKRLSALATRGARLNQLAADARQAAQGKVEAAFRTARELPDDTPGWGGMTPVSAKAMSQHGDSLAAMTASLAELAAIPADSIAKARAAQAPYDALVAVHDAGLDTAGLPDALRNAIRAALAAIDAAARLEIVSQRHAAMQNAFEGRIKAIREAHGIHCVCQN